MMKKELHIPEELFELANKEFEKNWSDDKVTIKRFLRGDVAKIQGACIKAKATMSSEFAATVDTANVQDMTVLSGVTAAPWPLNNPKAIQELPPPVFDWVYKELQEFNTLSVKKKETSATLREEEHSVTPK